MIVGSPPVGRCSVSQYVPLGAISITIWSLIVSLWDITKREFRTQGPNSNKSKGFPPGPGVSTRWKLISSSIGQFQKREWNRPLPGHYFSDLEENQTHFLSNQLYIHNTLYELWHKFLPVLPLIYLMPFYFGIELGTLKLVWNWRLQSPSYYHLKLLL